MYDPQYTSNDVKIKPFNGQYSAPDMLLFATQFIMPTLPTANCFALLAFFIGRLPPEGAGVSYKEIVARTCIKSNKTAYVTVNRFDEFEILLIDSRNKRDAENIYRLNPEFALTMPQKDAAYWLDRVCHEDAVADDDEYIGLNQVDEMGGVEFEHFIAKVLAHRGYNDVHVTQGSNDLGVDITATKDGIRWAIQAKRYKSPISRRAISDVVGGVAYYKCDRAMVITNSTLRKPARILAQINGCRVVDRDELLEWVTDYHK